MKKTISIVVVLIGIAVAVFLYINSAKDKQYESHNLSDVEVLSYVPADTWLFIGGWEAMEEHILSLLMTSTQSDQSLSIGKLFSIWNIKSSPAVRMIFGLDDEMRQSSYVGIAKKLGLDEQGWSVLYTIGILPVLRFQLDGSGTFMDFIKETERKHNINPTIGSIEGVEFRKYVNEEDISLVIAIHNNQAIVSLNSELADNVDLKLALGIEKPVKSILETDRLSDLMNRHGYKKYGLLFVDIPRLVENLVGVKTNSFTQMLRQSSPQSDLHEQSQTCKDEYVALAENWPIFSGGFTAGSAKIIRSKTILEGRNTDLVETIQKLQGHLSLDFDDDRIGYGMAVGLNTDMLIPVINDFMDRITKEDFKCKKLIQLQAEIRQFNPVMLSTMLDTYMPGFRGFSIALIDASFRSIVDDLEQNQFSDWSKLGAIINISGTDPIKLLKTTGGMFFPQLNLNLEDGGKAKPISLETIMPGLEVEARLRGHDLILSNSDKAHDIANEMKPNKKLLSNGLYRFLYKYAIPYDQEQAEDSGTQPLTVKGTCFIKSKGLVCETDLIVD